MNDLYIKQNPFISSLIKEAHSTVTASTETSKLLHVFAYKATQAVNVNLLAKSTECLVFKH